MKNQKGFTLILSLVLLLVMSLMGGGLIVLSSGDHRDNNTSEDYQQTFWVAEHALLEAEKQIINSMRGPWTEVAKIQKGEDQSDEEFLNYKNSLSVTDGFARHVKDREIPKNIVDAQDTDCFKSFRNLSKQEVPGDGGDGGDGGDTPAEEESDKSAKVTIQVINQNFGNLISPIISSVDSKNNAKELEYLERFRYEFFSFNVGSSSFKGTGSSVKKTSTNVQRKGTAYKIYGCGILMPKGSTTSDYSNPQILIPLESLIILSS